MQFIKITMNPSVKECFAFSERFKYSAVGKNLLQEFELISKNEEFSKSDFLRRGTGR